MYTIISAIFFSIVLLAPNAIAKDQDPNNILLTIFLKHDQTKNLGEIKEILAESKFNEVFPPKGTYVVSWYVMMGIGQVVTLEVPPQRLRDVNLAIERSGWKAYRTEFYPTYDLYPFIKDKLSNKASRP